MIGSTVSKPSVGLVDGGEQLLALDGAAVVAEQARESVGRTGLTSEGALLAGDGKGLAVAGGNLVGRTAGRGFMRLARRIIGTFVASHVGDDRGNEPREKQCGVDAWAP